MDFNYRTLFKLSLRHNYYSSGVLGRVGVKVSPGTAAMLKNYGLAWKHVKDQVAILYDTEDPHSLEKFAGLLQDEVKLQFWIYLEDGAFLNYTDLPFAQQEDMIYYFSNAFAHGKPDGNELKLSKSEYVSANDRVALFQGNSVILLRENKKDNKTEIIDIFNQPRGKIADKPEGFEVSELNEDGGYYAWNDGKAAYPFFVDRHFGWQKPFAVIEIFLNQTVKPDFRPVQDDFTAKPLNFSLDFNKRSVFWKYYVMSSHLRDLDGLAIANGKSGINFIGPQKEQVLGKHESESFISDRALDFTEARTYKFQLHKNFDPKRGGGKPVIKALPNPEPEQLKPIADKPGQYYTEIFIY